MKIDNRIYTEAQQLARQPTFKYLMLGLVSAAVVPTVYARHLYLPYVKDRELTEQLSRLPAEESGVAKESLLPQWDDELTYEMFSSIL